MIRKAVAGTWRPWPRATSRCRQKNASTLGFKRYDNSSNDVDTKFFMQEPQRRFQVTKSRQSLDHTPTICGSFRSFYSTSLQNDKDTLPPPSIVDIQPHDGDSTKELYADWSKNYEEDIRNMGYDMPEQVAALLVEHNILPPTQPQQQNPFVILDAGCGDGLSGVASRREISNVNAESNGNNYELVGTDVTPEMLDIAKTRGCYSRVEEMDLNQTLTPKKWQDNTVDLISCVGTMTYVEPNGPCLDEFVRIVKPGGYIVYTNRTDRLRDFRRKENELKDSGKWKLVECKGPLPYLPGNPDYGKDVEVKIFLYQVLEKESTNQNSTQSAATKSYSGSKRHVSSRSGNSTYHHWTGSRRSFSTSSSPNVKIVEVGPRDGLQNENQPITVQEKLQLIHRLQDAGIANLEVGAFVSPKWVPQMADSDKVLQGLEKDGRKKDKLQYSVLVPNQKGLESALHHADAIDEIAIFAAASEEFSQRNINSRIDESMDRFQSVVADLNDYNRSIAGTRDPIRIRGYVSTVIACPYQGSIEPKQVVKVVEQLLDLGCYEISLGDTIGAGTPGSIKAMLEAVLTSVAPKQLAMHCHDTYGQALANVLVGLEHDIVTIDSSVAGLGGCPYAKGASGNVATEDVVYMLHGMGLSTGIDLDALVDAGDYICQVLNSRETGSKVAKAIKAKQPTPTGFSTTTAATRSRRSFSTATALDDAVDTLIIGGGPVGSSTAFHLGTQRASLTQSDPSVTVVEQDPSYKSCSAVFSAGGIRLQFSLKENVLMSLYGVEFLRNCSRLLQPSNSDVQVDVQYVENGYLTLASSEAGKRQLEENFALYQQVGCDGMIQLLSPTQLAQKFPWIHTDDLLLGSYGTNGEGWFDPWSLLRGFQNKNKDLGVRYRSGRVVGATRDPETDDVVSVSVQTPDGKVEGIKVNTVVNAAGARAGQVMEILTGEDLPLHDPLPVHPKKRSIYFFHCDTNQCKQLIVPDVAPLTIDSSGAYFRSEGTVPGTGNFLCGISPPEEEDHDCWDPDELKNADPVLFENSIWPSIANRVPAFNCVKVVSSWAGLYDVNVVDHNCILDFHPELRNVLMVNGFSGHGLQHSPAAGRAAAELVDNNNRFTTIDLDIFRFDRLMDGGVPVLERGIY